MSRRWLIEAKNHTLIPGVWGDVVSIDLRPLLVTPQGAQYPKITSIRLRKVMIPFVIWNVTTDNQTLTITIAGVPYVATVPVGYYSGTALITAVTGAINAALGATPNTISILLGADYRVTILVNPFPTPYTLDSTTIAGLSPSILTMFGFATDPLVSVGGTETSTGPLNVVTDRCLIVTCDEAKGANGRLDSLSPLAWHNGIVSIVPIEVSVNSGDVIAYLPEDDAPWVDLVKGNTNGYLTLRLCRLDYPTMGVAQLSWVTELEIRP